MKSVFTLLKVLILILIFVSIKIISAGVPVLKDNGTKEKKEIQDSVIVRDSIFFKDTIIAKCPTGVINEDWHIAEASYYDCMDSTQTKSSPDGIGDSGRLIESGSISLGSIYTSEIIKKKRIVFVQIKDLDIVTPYGKGIFRVDDAMHERYNQEGLYYIDFLDKDLGEELKRKGRFNVEFKFKFYC